MGEISLSKSRDSSGELVQSGRDLKIKEQSDEDIAKNLVPAKDTEAQAKNISEAYFAVAKLFEHLHAERDISADDLFEFLQHPREKKSDRIAKEIKKYFAQHQDLAGSVEQQQTIKAVFKDLTKWVGSYREFVDFVEETHVLKDMVRKLLEQHKLAKKAQKRP